MTDATLLRAVRHNAWANLVLLAFCETLTDEQLAASVPGTFGPIHATLQHLINGDRTLLWDLTGEEPHDDVRRTPTGYIRISDLVAVERRTAERLERLLADEDVGVRRVAFHRERVEGNGATAAVTLAFLLHHGNDHRAQISTTLSAHGVCPPMLDVWTYAETIGEITRVPA